MIGGNVGWDENGYLLCTSATARRWRFEIPLHSALQIVDAALSSLHFQLRADKDIRSGGAQFTSGVTSLAGLAYSSGPASH
ncbi:MAG: hypothetical protein EOP09_00075 [Proteobacteria bacterium]|nr:MAG: hypothetical protein EOP09_00075 [Pseudomonadota bacterium]